jgi:hypothetical protein
MSILRPCLSVVRLVRRRKIEIRKIEIRKIEIRKIEIRKIVLALLLVHGPLIAQYIDLASYSLIHTRFTSHL